MQKYKNVVLFTFFVLENSYFPLKLCHYTIKLSNYLNHGESENNDNVYMNNVEGNINAKLSTENKFFSDYEFVIVTNEEP